MGPKSSWNPELWRKEGAMELLQWKTVWYFLSTLNVGLPHRKLDSYKWKMRVQTKTYTLIFNIALLILVQSGSSLSTSQLMNSYPHSTEGCPGALRVGRKEAWGLSPQHGFDPPIKRPGTGESTELQNRSVAASGWGREKWGGIACRVQALLSGCWNVPEIDSGDGCATLWICWQSLDQNTLNGSCGEWQCFTTAN